MMHRQALEEIERSGIAPSPLLTPKEAVLQVQQGDRSVGVLSYVRAIHTHTRSALSLLSRCVPSTHAALPPSRDAWGACTIDARATLLRRGVAAAVRRRLGYLLASLIRQATAFR
jgi:hypothetical protein